MLWRKALKNNLRNLNHRREHIFQEWSMQKTMNFKGLYFVIRNGNYQLHKLTHYSGKKKCHMMTLTCRCLKEVKRYIIVKNSSSGTIFKNQKCKKSGISVASSTICRNQKCMSLQ